MKIYPALYLSGFLFTFCPGTLCSALGFTAKSRWHGKKRNASVRFRGACWLPSPITSSKVRLLPRRVLASHRNMHGEWNTWWMRLQCSLSRGESCPKEKGSSIRRLVERVRHTGIRLFADSEFVGWMESEIILLQTKPKLFPFLYQFLCLKHEAIGLNTSIAILGVCVAHYSAFRRPDARWRFTRRVWLATFDRDLSALFLCVLEG